MIFDSSRALAIIFAYPEPHVHFRLLSWLSHIGIPTKRTLVVTKRDNYCAYNTAIRDLALKSDPGLYDWFIFADHDIAPTLETDAVILDERDVVGVQYDVADHAFLDETSFHAGLWRTHRAALTAIQPPWFLRTYSADGCDAVDCGCNRLRRLFLAQGFTCGHAGRADHKRRSI